MAHRRGAPGKKLSSPAVLPAGADAIFQGRGAVLGDRHAELRREGRRLGVFLVDADVARGERNPEPGFFFIFEFVINHDGIFQRGAGILLVAIVVALAIDYEYFLDGNARTLEKTDLLGLFVFDGGLSA